MAIVEHLKNAAVDGTKVRSSESQLKDVILAKDRVTKQLTLELEQSQGQSKSLETELEWVKAKLEGLEQRFKELQATIQKECKDHEERLGVAESQAKVSQDQLIALQNQLAESQAWCLALSEANEKLNKGEAALKEQVSKLAHMGMRVYSKGFKKPLSFNLFWILHNLFRRRTLSTANLLTSDLFINIVFFVKFDNLWIFSNGK